MRIIIIGTAYPYRGGLAAYNERMAEELNDAGHSVHIHTFRIQYPRFIFPGKTQYSTEKKTPKTGITRSINSINPLNWWRTGNKIKREKPDLVLIKSWLPFMGPCFGPILRQIKKNKHTKVIAILDNIIPHQKSMGDKTFTRYFLRPVDGCVVMSKSVSEDLKQFNITKPRIFSPHPLFDHFGEKIKLKKAQSKLNLNPGYKYMLFFGLIRPYKGLDLLIKAMSFKENIKDNIKLLIAGEVYSKEAYYTDLIEKYHLNDKVIFHNRFIPDEEVKYYFSAVDLVVQPYKSATQSGVTQIAYHFDKPMIVTDVGGLKEMCPPGRVGYITAPEPKDISKAIGMLFEDENRQLQMVENVKNEKKKYSWGILIQNILLLLDKIKRDEIH